MVPRSTSTSRTVKNQDTSETGTPSSRSTLATTRKQITQLVTQTLFLLVIGVWLQVVSSAPTPAQSDVAVAEHPDDSSLLNRLTDTGKNEANKSIATHFSDGWWRKVEVEKPPDIRSRSDRQYFTGSNVDLMYSSRKDESNSSSETAQSPTLSPLSTRQNVSQEDGANMVFNIVIQKERAEKSAFIAPDVNWLRDLVPKVVDVADKPEQLIKETIVDAMDDENAIDVEQMRGRQLFINVVKSEIGSEVEVPEILARLRNLMRTGGPAVESILLESRDIGVPQKLIYVINIIIFNFVVLEAAVEKPILITDKVSHIEHDITEDSYLVALKESQQNRFDSSSIGRNKIQAPENVENNQPRIPDSAIEEDSYITALRESQKNRNKVSSPVINHHHHHHLHAKPHHGPHIVPEEASHQFNGHYLTEVPTYAYASTARPLMAMEKDYLRRFTIKPTQQPVDVGNKLEQLVNEEEQSADEVDKPADEEELLTIMPEHLPTLVDPNASIEFVNLPTGPYFTNPAVDTVQIVNTEPSSIEKPPEIEAVVVDIADAVGSSHNQIQATTRKPVAKKPLIVRVPEAVGVMTNKATNMMRNRIRTVGMLGIPMMVGLASTVNSWLPSVTGLGRRKRRSISEDQFQEMTYRNRNPSRTIEVAQTLARLMGKHYANKEAPRKTTDDREDSSVPVDDSNKPVQVSPNRSLWFPFRRPANTRLNSGNMQRHPGAGRSAFARKMKQMKSNTRKYMTPLFYTTFFANEDAPEIMERAESAIDESEHQDDIVEPPQVTEDVMEHHDNAAMNEGNLDNLTEQDEVVEDVMEQREAIEHGTESTKPLISSAVGPPVEYDEYKPEETETQMEEKTYEIAEEETPQTLPAFNSPLGFDFDIVSNFVRAMMMNNQENKEDLPEAREEVFWIKEATIVNATETGDSKFQKGSNMLLLKPGGSRLPSSVISGNKISVFSADSLRPNSINSENVTNNPLTYVSVKSPTKVTWLGVGPPDAITSSTQSTSSAEIDATAGEINDNDPLGLPPSEIVGAPLQFYDEETDNYVSKEVPSVPGSPTASYYTNRTPSTERIPSNDIASEQSPSVIEEISGPIRPLWQSTDLRPGLSNLLLTIASFNRPRLPPSIEVSNSSPTMKYTLAQGFVTSQQDEFNSDTTDKYTHGHGIVSKPDDVSKYTHGHGTIVTNAPVHDLNLLTGESSLVSDTVANSNMLFNLFKGTGNNQDGQSTSPTLLGETSVQFVGIYGGTSVDSTVGPFTATGISDSEELHSTLDDLITQLQANWTTGLVSTDRPMGGIHFTNTSTDIVIINPFVTPSSVFPMLQVEAVEAEEGETSGAIENADETASADTIVVDALDGSQPDSVANVSNLANLFFASSGGGGSSGGISGGSFPSDASSGGVTGDSVSSSNTNSIALLYTFGLAAVGVLLLTLPIWIPFVVTRIKRRTYAPSKTYPASKKKPTYGYSSSPPRKTYAEPPPNHYKDLDEDEMYGNDHYLDQHQLGSGATQPQYQSTTIEDLFRPNAGDLLSSSDYALNSEDQYIFRDSIALNPRDNMFSHPGPLSSEAIYGSPARIYLKARR